MTQGHSSSGSHEISQREKERDWGRIHIPLAVVQSEAVVGDYEASPHWHQMEDLGAGERRPRVRTRRRRNL